MATLNRILIVIITLLAIAAAVMSYLLFERRDEFRERASILADTVVGMVRNLDEESQTNLSREVTFSRADDGPESGSLSWQRYNEDPQNTAQALERAEDLAAAVNTQRNYLASSMEQLAYALGLPVEELSAEQLTSVGNQEDYQEAGEKVLRLAHAVGDRADDMIRTIIESSDILDPQLVDDENLRERKSDVNEDGEPIYGEFLHEPELEKFKNAISNINRRATDYANTLADAMNKVSAWNWETSANQLTDTDGYTQALVSLGNDFQDLNQRLITAEQDRVRLEQMEKQLTETKDDLREATDKRNDLQAQVDQLKADLTRVRPAAPSGPRPVVPGEFEVSQDLEGKILHVNDEYKFVILDLGAQDIPENTELIVARGEELIGRVLVTRVTPRISVAEILPSPKLTEQVQENDRVIPPRPL